MCGIIGYTGFREVAPILIGGLKRLEYRGYDSAGISIMNGVGLQTRKSSGKISNLEQLIKENPTAGHTGIGHTRWATHGEPTTQNAHPHADCDGKFSLIHNGIV